MTGATYVGGTATSSTGATSLNPGLPPGYQAGDVFVAVTMLSTFATAQFSASGWTSGGHFPDGGSSGPGTVDVLYKVAASASETPPTFTHNAGSAVYCSVVLLCFRGAAATSPIHAANRNGYASATTAFVAPALTANAHDTLIVCDLSFTNSPGVSTPPSGMTAGAANLTGDRSSSYYQLDVPAGDTGTRTSTMSGAAKGSAVSLLVKANNSAPNAPIPTSPANNATVDRSQSITLAATFSDPDPSDSPSASQWRYRLVGAATWATVTQNNPLQSYSLPAGLAAGNYEWQAAYADQQGVWGPFCGSAFFTAADPPSGPTWLDPTNGQTIATSSYTGVISTPSLDKSEWTLYADNAGAISSTVLQGPVTVTTGDLRSHTFTGLANNVPVWWSVRTSSGGLWSQPVQIRTPVSYTGPAAPTVILTPGVSSLVVGITNPAPGAGEPTVAYNDVYVDDGKGLGWERVATMLAPNTDYTYALPRSGYDYSGHIKVVAVASNGTTSEAIA